MRHNIKIIYFYEQQQHIVFYIHQHQTAQCSQKTQTQSVSFISNVENGKWITWMRKALHLFNSQWNRATNNSLGTITANHDPWVCFMMLFVPRSVSTSLNNHLFSLSLLFYTFFFLNFCLLWVCALCLTNSIHDKNHSKNEQSASLHIDTFDMQNSEQLQQ